jgi:hypothetical protein
MSGGSSALVGSDFLKHLTKTRKSRHKKFSSASMSSVEKTLQRVSRRYDCPALQAIGTSCSLLLSEPNSADKIRQFTIVLESYLALSKSPEFKKAVVSTTPELCHVILCEASKFGDSRECIALALQALFQANAFVPIANHCQEINTFFLTLCVSASRFTELIAYAFPFFSAMFGQKVYAMALARSVLFPSILQAVFFEEPSIQVGGFLEKLVSYVFPDDFFAVLPYRDILPILLRDVSVFRLTDDRRTCLAVFISSLFKRLSGCAPNFSAHFREIGGLLKYADLLSVLPPANQISFFSGLFMARNDDNSPPPNLHAWQSLPELLSKRPELRGPVLEHVFGSMLTETDFCERAGKVVPFSQFFDFASSVNRELLQVFVRHVSRTMPEQIPACLPGLFATLREISESPDWHQECLLLIHSLFLKRVLSLSALVEDSFLDVFVLHAPPEFLEQFLRSSTSSQLIIDVAARVPENERRLAIFMAILSLRPRIGDKNTFACVLSGFLIAIPSEENIKCLMDEIDISLDSSLFDALTFTFLRSVASTDAFLALSGGEWILDHFADGDLPTGSFVSFLAALVSWKESVTLGATIESLNSSHPLFQIDRASLKRIVFGEGRTAIRVPALFHLCEFPDRTISPYNAFVIGSNVLRKIPDLSKLPCLAAVANRFVNLEDVHRLLSLTERLPEFCDLSADHFPLFEFMPGTGDFTVEIEFQSLSFWFKFASENEKEVQILHCGPLVFTVSEKRLMASCESQVSIFEINPTKWTHLYIRIERPSSRAQGIRISVNIGVPILLDVTGKLDCFCGATFVTNKSAPTLFLGPAIRFSDRTPADISALIAAGPQFTKQSALDEKLIVTPDSKDQVLPLNCYQVRYCGFSLFLSRVDTLDRALKIFAETGDRTVYNAVFTAVCNAGRIAGICTWWRLIQAVKIAALRPTEAVFVAGLSTISTAPNCDMMELFVSTVYDSSLWAAVDNFILVSALFHCFPGLDWGSAPRLEVSLAEIALQPSADARIICLFLQNYRKVPGTVKLLMAFFKSGTITEWPCATDRTDCRMQFMIVDALLEIANAQTVKMIASLLPFSELRLLFVVSSDDLAAKVFHLISVINQHQPDFLETDAVLQHRLARLARSESVWRDVLQIVTGNPDGQSSKLHFPELLPLLLTLVWSLGMQICHAKLALQSIDFSHVEPLLANCCDYLKRCVNVIIGSVECMTLILNYFPAIMNYHAVLSENFKFDREYTFRPIPQLKPANLSDVEDPMWAGMSGNVQFPICESPLSPRAYLSALVSQVLMSTEWEGEANFPAVLNWISTAPLFGFIGTLVCHSLTTAPSLFLCRPFFDHSLSVQFLPGLVIRIFGEVRTPLPPEFSLQNLLLFLNSCLPFLWFGAGAIFTELGRVIGIVSLDAAERQAELITHVGGTLLAKMDGQEIPQCLPEFAVVAAQRKLLSVWIVRLLALFETIPRTFSSAVAPLIDEADRPVLATTQAPEDGKTRIDELARKWPPGMAKAASPVVFGETSFAVTRAKYIASCKHYLLAKYLAEMLSTPSLTPVIARE